jgi:hypothetical protein
LRLGWRERIVAVRVPIACTLATDDASDRIEEWRRFLNRSDVVADRTSGEQLRIRLGPLKEDLLAAVDLAERERACCEFFQFSVELGPESRWLVVGVPPEAIGILDDFQELLPAPSDRTSVVIEPVVLRSRRY